MNDDTGHDNNGNHGTTGGTAANTAGAAFTIAGIIAFLQAYWHEVGEALTNGAGHLRHGFNWLQAKSQHDAVVYLRRKTSSTFIILNLGHLVAAIIVLLQYETTPEHFWMLWLIPLAIIDAVLVLLLVYAWDVREVTNYDPTRHRDEEAFVQAFGPNGRSPLLILGTLFLVLIFGGMLFFVPYTVLSLGAGQWWFNIPASWLGFFGMTYSVMGVFFVGATIKVLAGMIGGVFAAIVGIGTLGARNAAAAGTITVTADNAAEQIRDYADNFRRAGAWLSKTAGTPAVPVLIVQLYWLVFPHPYTPLVTIMFLIGSGAWDFIYTNRELDVLESQQKKVLASGMIWGLGLIGALLLALWGVVGGVIMSGFVGAFGMPYKNLGILTFVFVALCAACIWGAVKLHATWAKHQKEAGHPITPSRAVTLLGIGAGIFAVPVALLFTIWVGHAMGYSVHSSAPSNGPAVLAEMKDANGNVTNTYTLVSNTAPSSQPAASTTTTGTSTHHARSNTPPSTSGRVKHITHRSERIDPYFQ